MWRIFHYFPKIYRRSFDSFRSEGSKINKSFGIHYFHIRTENCTLLIINQILLELTDFWTTSIYSSRRKSKHFMKKQMHRNIKSFLMEVFNWKVLTRLNNPNILLSTSFVLKLSLRRIVKWTMKFIDTWYELSDSFMQILVEEKVILLNFQQNKCSTCIWSKINRKGLISRCFTIFKAGSGQHPM